ncbi:MAG: mechanosensitive ion channel family protein, partial [Alphaproteobacteria bacterium]
IQLRHQNGQVHTIPFGQLGAITNFSRDWITVKFNLRFAMGTDLELVRKTAKKIGQEMLEDPELKPIIIEPLKLQGLADIAENSLVLRFKFTARPGNPTLVQRQAIHRLFKAFSEKGIEFARATVSVHTVAGTPGVSPEAGAAAHAARPASAGE